MMWLKWVFDKKIMFYNLFFFHISLMLVGDFLLSVSPCLWQGKAEIVHMSDNKWFIGKSK